MTEIRETITVPTRWARAADALAAVLGAVAAWAAATGGSRHIVLGIVISFRTPSLFLYAAASLLIIRHVLEPHPSTWARLRAANRALGAKPGVSAVIGPFIATRLGVLLVALFAVVTFGLPPKPGFVLSADPLANLPARFDAGWYGEIALDGYHWDNQFQRQRNIAFFPALPLLMRPVGAIFGMYQQGASRERRMLRALWGGVVVSLAAFLCGLWYFARVGEELLGRERGASAALLLAAYPFSCFYSAPYTESLFLLGAAGAWYHFRREQWVASAVFGLLAGLSRPNGCFVSVPLGILALQYGWRLSRAPGERMGTQALRATAVRLLTAAVPGLGMLAFTAFLYNLSGVWFAWAKSHQAWGRTYQGMDPIVAAFGWVRDVPLVQVITNSPFNSLNTLGLLFAVALLVPVFRRVGAAWGIFVLVNLALPLLAGGVLSMGRLTSTLFPVFLALAAVIPSRSVPSWAVAFGIMQGLCAALFFTWRELF